MFAQRDIAVLFDAARLELNTPVHYIALKVWMHFSGASEFSTRYFSVACGVLTVALASRLVQGKRESWLATLFAAVLPVSIHTSQETRMYAMVTMWCVGSVVFMRRCVTKSDLKSRWTWAALNLAALGTHVLAAFVFAGQAVVLLNHALRKKEKRIDFVAPIAFVCAITCLLAVTIVGLSRGYGTTYTEPLNFIDTLMKSIAASALPRLLPVTFVLASAVLVSAIVFLSIVKKQITELATVALIFWIGVTAFCSLTGKFSGRYAAIVAPIVAAIAGLAVVNLPRIYTMIVSISILVLCVFGITQLRTNALYANEDFRGAAEYLENNVQFDETILLVSGHFSPVFEYYFGKSGWHALPPDEVLKIQNTLDYESAVPLLNRALKGKRGVWVLKWQNVEIDPSNIIDTMLRRQAHLLSPDLESKEFEGLSLMHYTFDAPYLADLERLPEMKSRIERVGAERGLDALGCHQYRKPSRVDKSIEVLCFWKLSAAARLPYNTMVSLRLIDEQGRQVAQSDQQLAATGLPIYRYEKPIVTVYTIPLPDVLANTITLRAIPYLPNEEIAPQIELDVEAAQ